MREIACAVAVFNLGDKSYRVAQLLFELVAVECVVILPEAVYLHVEQGCCYELGCFEARIEVRSSIDLLYQLVGNGFAGLVVLSIRAYTKDSAEITDKVAAKLSIPRQFFFHTKDIMEIPVEIVRLERYG